MNKKEILGLCEFLKLHGFENTDNISKFIFGLQQENKKLNGAIQTYDILLKSNIEESKQLKAQIEEYQKALDETMSEKIDIQNNWNKLKKWVNKHYDYYMNNEDYIGGRLCFNDMKNKMKELEGSDSNAKK